jgi:two-component system phosphate regulon sensor histidine kinase PhoR
MNEQNILNSLEIGVALISRRGEVSFINEYLVKRGLAVPQWEGKRYYEAMSSMNLISVIHDLLDRESINTEYEEKGKWYRVLGSLEGDSFLIQIIDITELKRCEVSQREFLANVSHELKTPLAVVKTTLETLWEEEDSRRKRFIEKALGRLRELIEIIDSIYYLTFLELSKAKRFSPVELYELIEEVVSYKVEDIRSKDIKLKLDLREDVKVMGDYEKLKIMLSNLIDNSVKYNVKGGEIYISAKEEGDKVILSIRDTGIGIEPTKIPLIFQPFFRASSEKGLGLGLSIAQKIAHFHGTSIEVESTEGEGTTFRVHLIKG